MNAPPAHLDILFAIVVPQLDHCLIFHARLGTRHYALRDETNVQDLYISDFPFFFP